MELTYFSPSKVEEAFRSGKFRPVLEMEYKDDDYAILLMKQKKRVPSEAFVKTMMEIVKVKPRPKDRTYVQGFGNLSNGASSAAVSKMRKYATLNQYRIRKIVDAGYSRHM